MSRVANAILKRLPQQAAVLNDGGSLPEEFINARRSVLIENERKAQKAAWLGVVAAYEEHRVDLHSSLAGCMQEASDRAVFKNVAIHHTTAQVCLVRLEVWKKSLEILRREGFSPCHGVARLLKAWENGCCSCWTTWPWFWVLRRHTEPRPHMSRNLCHPLATFTIPEDNPADEPSRLKRYRPSMHSDVDQCGPSARGVSS